MKTVSKDLAIKLKEAGYPQEESYFYITFDTFTNQEELKRYSPAYIPSDKKYIPDDWYASPTADELGEILPQYYMTDKQDGEWFVVKLGKTIRKIDVEEALKVNGKFLVQMETYKFNTNTEADTRAALWLYLKEQSLISQKEKIQ